MGIHINKTAEIWRSKDNVLNMVVPDRADGDMPIFEWRQNEADTTAYATTSGSQYDSDNDSNSEFDTTNWISNNNVVLWFNRTPGKVVNFDRDDFFPLLYLVTVWDEENEQNVRYLRPIYFSMFPSIVYTPTTDRISLTFWNNVKVHQGGILEKFTYLPYSQITTVDYEIGNVISTDNTTVSTGTYKRALFMTEGEKISGWFNEDLVIEGVHSNTAQNYNYRETYLFEIPRIIFVPQDSTSEPVIDVGGTGGGLTNHRHFYEDDGSIAWSTPYPTSGTEVVDSGIVHVIPAVLQT